MKLLIFTQKVDADDDVLGFFHDWASEFARHVEKLTVVCLYEGRHNLPANVKVLSLGKDKYPLDKRGKGVFVRRIVYIYRFYKYVLSDIRNYEAVFVHMNYEYILLGGLIWRLAGKKIGLWYAHGKTSSRLKFAEVLSHYIFTSTQSGFRLNSPKKKVVGQGIDIDKFKPHPQAVKKPGEFRIVTVGRISPAKDIETLIRAVEILKSEANLPAIYVEIVGGAGLKEQEKYFAELKSTVKEKKLENIIKFIGPVPNRKILTYLQNNDLFVNMSHTGSLDKAMLEAMAVGLPVLTCNEAMLEVFGDYKERLMYGKSDPKVLAAKIEEIIGLSPAEYGKLSDDMRQIVVRDHSLPGLIGKIMEKYKE